MAAPDPASLENGVIPIGRLEIAQLANNPNFPERGRLDAARQEAANERRRRARPSSSPAPKPAAAAKASRRARRRASPTATGLSAIAYRIGEYAQFKDEHASPGCRRRAIAALDALRTRDADDFTIGLIDAVACAADVLTFYQERMANESYLRTATERVSLQEMAKLIGYRLRPGVAAETWLAFALETPTSAAARPAARARVRSSPASRPR